MLDSINSYDTPILFLFAAVLGWLTVMGAFCLIGGAFYKLARWLLGPEEVVSPAELLRRLDDHR